MKKIFGIILGALLILGGIVFALDALGIAQVNISFDGWWTVFIIIPSLYGLITSKDKISNLIILAIGIYLLLTAQGIIEHGMFWKLFVPVIIVLIGIKIIIKAFKGDESVHTYVKDDVVECASAFDTKTSDFTGENVKIAKIGAVFGGTKCNLSDACFDKKSQIDLFCMFGGSDIIVPDYVDIKINAFCLFGGISDKRIIKEDTEKTAELVINGFCFFGGADIK